jgi:hypothetical protein
MIRTILPSAALAVTLAFSLPANATLLTRTFVSSAGNDSNPCTITQPCATFAHAYTLTATTGIIAALDPGKYGPLTITGPITINGYGWAAITGPAQGNAITVSAGVNDSVALIGLEIDGAGAAYNGIVFNAGLSLVVTNCTLQAFVGDGTGRYTTGNGILIQPTSGTVGFNISNTTVASNAQGITYLPPSGGSPDISGVLNHVVANNNHEGVSIWVPSPSGGSATITISNTEVSNNTDNGIQIETTIIETRVSIDNVTAVSDGYGIAATGNPNVLVGRSVITNNKNGISNQTSPNNFYTYKDNRIDFNDFGNSGNALLLKSVQ